MFDLHHSCEVCQDFPFQRFFHRTIKEIPHGRLYRGCLRSCLLCLIQVAAAAAAVRLHSQSASMYGHRLTIVKLINWQPVLTQAINFPITCRWLHVAVPRGGESDVMCFPKRGHTAPGAHFHERRLPYFEKRAS